MHLFAPSAPAWLTEATVTRVGKLALLTLLGLCLLLLTVAMTVGGPVLYAIPVVILAIPVGIWLFMRPELNILVLIVGFGLINDRVDGIQLMEAVYGLYYLAFLGLWALHHLYQRRTVLASRENVALLVFLIGITCSLALTVLFGGSLRQFMSEWIALLFLGLFFPIYHMCASSKRQARRIIAASAGLGMLIVVQNLLNYRRVLSSAEAAWEVVKGRVAAGDNELMFASLILLTLLVFAETWKYRTFFLGLFLFFLAGLILTQSRGFWVGFAVGALALFFRLDRQRKIQFVLLSAAGMTGFIAVGLLLFQEIFLLVLGGLFDRLLSLGSATASDISLVNRFYESAAVWDMIRYNPILGYGLGVEFAFFDIIDDFTMTRSFVHNGYLSLWFRAGLWGLALILVFWLGAIRRGYQAFAYQHADPFLRCVALGIACALIGLLLPANTSNPFFPKNTIFAFTLLTGMVCGLEALLRPAPPQPAPSPDASA